MRQRNRAVVMIVTLALASSAVCQPAKEAIAVGKQCSEPDKDVGAYFTKKQYLHTPLPKFEEVKNRLPSPIYDDNPLWVQAYWRAWELAFKNFHEPGPESGFVSQFIDASFNRNIFLWDSSFMTMFCNFGSPLVPCISTLDNFYAKQQEDGEITREIARDTGRSDNDWVNHECKPLYSSHGWIDVRLLPDGRSSAQLRPWDTTYVGREIPHPNPVFTLDALDHPIPAWAELESYRVTGDKGRLEAVWEPLVHYYSSLQKYLRQGNGLYMTDWASMDNSPRNRYLEGGGVAVDTSSEMVLFARNLSQIAEILGKKEEAERYAHDADTLARVINEKLWDKKRKFYFDLTVDNQRSPVKTIAAYWTLIAHVASPQQAKDLVRELSNPRTFGRPNAIPSLAADEPAYDRLGGYWKGSVWAPTTTMVVRGLEGYGYDDLARQIAVQHVNLVANVYKSTGTFWENYSPEEAAPGKPAKGDFVGWSGIGPIMFFLEYGIGLKPDAARNELIWDLEPGGRRGCDRFWFNGHVVSLIAQPYPGGSRKILLTVDSDGSFTLRIVRRGTNITFHVEEGKQQFTIG